MHGFLVQGCLKAVTRLQVTHITPVDQAHQSELQVPDHCPGLGPRSLSEVYQQQTNFGR